MSASERVLALGRLKLGNRAGGENECAIRERQHCWDDARSHNSTSQCESGLHPSYGTDVITEQAANAVRELFDTNCEVFFVPTGTSANALALSSLCNSYHSVICHESSHIETDECGGPEFFSNGTKLLLGGGDHGKLDPMEIGRIAHKRTDIHYPKPRVVSISQATELGTVYSPAELEAISEAVRQNGLALHMDGARFANSVASLGVEPKAITWERGIDVLSLGMIKNGFGLSEAVVFFIQSKAAQDAAVDFGYRCKQAGHLFSKMRYFAAPWVAALTNGVWLDYAKRANNMAKYLAEQIAQVKGVRILHPVEANAVFVEMAPQLHAQLSQRGWKYYVFIGGGARFMCSWSTSREDVDSFIAALS